MSVSIKLAIPSMGNGGLDAQRSGHFGQCDCFTIVDINDGELGTVSVLSNPPHEEGGCLRPVKLLGDAGVEAIVAAGMGMRPLVGFNEAGITVYYDAINAEVKQAAELVAQDKAPVMGTDEACNHHH